MFDIYTLKDQCPYCWSPIQLLIDCSVCEQEYIEDCEVCCRPMIVKVMINDFDNEDSIPSVILSQENEA